MELIIGRTNDNTNRLRIAMGKKEKVYGNTGSVKQCVSRLNHFSLEDKGNGEWLVKNLNPANETFVNGVSVDSARVKQGDKIELGSERYLFEWDSIAEVIPVTIDLRPLRWVWENYHDERMKIQSNQGKFNALSGLTGIFSMVGMIAAFIPGLEAARIFFIILAIFGIIITTVIRFAFASSTPKKLDALDRRFQQTYVCPNPKCGIFMGNQPYQVLAQKDQCPHCKAKYVNK